MASSSMVRMIATPTAVRVRSRRPLPATAIAARIAAIASHGSTVATLSKALIRFCARSNCGDCQITNCLSTAGMLFATENPRCTRRCLTCSMIGPSEMLIDPLSVSIFTAPCSVLPVTAATTA